jgi:hypothetical protein
MPKYGNCERGRLVVGRVGGEWSNGEGNPNKKKEKALRSKLFARVCVRTECLVSITPRFATTRATSLAVSRVVHRLKVVFRESKYPF